jgi:uncharacterized small protein (DUF1192 family)
MDDEDDIRPLAEWAPKNLDTMSIEQLDDYVADLEREIARVQNEIRAKKEHMSSAEALFKK